MDCQGADPVSFLPQVQQASPHDRHHNHQNHRECHLNHQPCHHDGLPGRWVSLGRSTNARTGTAFVNLADIQSHLIRFNGTTIITTTSTSSSPSSPAGSPKLSSLSDPRKLIKIPTFCHFQADVDADGDDEHSKNKLIV